MSLRDHQVIFAKNIGLLIGYIFSKGYEITLSEAYRTPLQAWVNALPKGSSIMAKTPAGVKIEWTDKVGGTGSSKSLHKLRLAQDLNLFLNGAYLTTDEHWKQFGDYWKTLHILNRWGGDFIKKVGNEIIPTPDANHFSMEYEGMK